MPISFDDILEVLQDEREYQDRKWGTIEEHPHSIVEWLSIIRHYCKKAEKNWNMGYSDGMLLMDVVKIMALASACLEQHGLGEYRRFHPDRVAHLDMRVRLHPENRDDTDHGCTS